MNSWWTIKQIKASHRLTFTYLEHHEDLGVRSCKDPELPINALGTTLINLVNLLKICSNHLRHHKNVVVLVLRKKKKRYVFEHGLFSNYMCERFSFYHLWSSRYEWKLSLEVRALWSVTLDYELFIPSERTPALIGTLSTQWWEIEVQTHFVAKAYLSRCLNATLSFSFYAFNKMVGWALIRTTALWNNE